MKVDKIRVFFNHPGYVETFAENVEAALSEFPIRDEVKLLFTAHSIPMGMASGSKYVVQLEESCRLVAEQLGHANWELVYQSRSGPPMQPWLEPDVCDRIGELHEKEQTQSIVIAPIGFISDHMEVLFDLDTEAKELCEKLGIKMVRSATVGIHPRFVQMIRELIVERMVEDPVRLALGEMGPNHDVCPVDCCSYVKPTGRPGGRPSADRPAT